MLFYFPSSPERFGADTDLDKIIEGKSPKIFLKIFLNMSGAVFLPILRSIDGMNFFYIPPEKTFDFCLINWNFEMEIAKKVLKQS